jgi:hypothetical protein
VGAGSGAGDVSRTGLDPDEIVTELLQRVLCPVSPGLADRNHEHDGGDSDGDPERRQ